MTGKIDFNALVQKVDQMQNVGNNNGKIDTREEISIFTNEAIEAGAEITEIEQFLNGVTNPIVKPQLSKKEKERIEKEVAEEVKTLAKSGKDIDGIKEGLTRKFAARYSVADADETHKLGDFKYDNNNKLMLNPNYVEAIAEVEKVFNAIKTNGSIKEAKKTYSSNLTDFQKKLFKSLEDVAENTNAQQYYNTKLKDRYQTKIDNAKAANSSNPHFIPEYEKYAKDIIDDLKNDKENWKKQEVKDAAKLLEENAKAQALSRAQELIKEAKGDRKTMRSYGKDDYYREAIQDLKTDRKVIKRQDKVEKRQGEIANVNREELDKDLDKKVNLGVAKVRTGGGESLADKLEVYKNEDGTYNMAELSKALLSRIGYDYKLSRNDSDKEMSEIKNIQEHLKSLTGKDFTENEVKRLCKFCKIPIEHKDHSFSKLLYGVPNIISGFLGGAIAKHGNLMITQNTTVNIDISQKQSIIDSLNKEGVQYSISENGTNVSITILQQVIKNDRMLNAIMGALAGTNIGALEGLVLLAFGSGKDEKSCVSVSDYSIKEDKYTDINAYKQYVDQRYGHNEIKAAAMKALADQCYKEHGDKWHEVYNQIIREMAGIGSKLNPEECIGFKYQEKSVETPKEEPTVERTYVVSDDCGENKEETVPIEYPEVKGVAWEVMAERYDCLDEYLPSDWSPNKKHYFKTRLVKVMQSVINDDYSLTNLKDLTDRSFTVKPKKKLSSMTPAEKEALKNEIRAAFQDVQGFDVENYINNFFANTIGTQKIPAIKVDDNTECVYDGAKQYNIQIRNGKPTGKSNHTGDTKTCTIYGEKTATIETSDGQKWVFRSNEQAEFQKKKAELDNQGYKGSGNTDCYDAGR